MLGCAQTSQPTKTCMLCFTMASTSNFQRLKTAIRNALAVFVAIVLLPLLVPIVLVIIAAWLLWGIALQAMVWLFWCTRGTHLLLVYSDSPVWHDYIEENMITRLPSSSVVLNWSRRRTWRWYQFPVMLFHYFAGTRAFNPIIIVFRPFRWAKTFRFWQAFKDHKHGNKKSLDALEQELFAYLARHKI